MLYLTCVIVLPARSRSFFLSIPQCITTLASKPLKLLPRPIKIFSGAGKHFFLVYKLRLGFYAIEPIK
jgi:hypothetical protein